MIKEEIERIIPDVAAIRRQIHKQPELGFEEYKTAAIVADYLNEIGIEVITGIAETGVIGILDSGKKGKTLMLRADMDALPIEELIDCDFKSQNEGVMHACGHDFHTAMLLGAAKILSQNRDKFCGRIKFVFQPAEEGSSKETAERLKNTGYAKLGGARSIIASGLLDDVDQAVVLHVDPSLPLGKIRIPKKAACAGSYIFDITLVGKGGHGSAPQNAIDPLPATAQLITAIHSLTSRAVSPHEPCVLSIGTVETPGSTWNAIAERVRITGGLRTFDKALKERLKARLHQIAGGIASANCLDLEFKENDGCDPVINNEELALLIAENAKKVYGAENVVYTDEPMMFSEDSAYYLEKIPGAFIMLGTGSDQPLHSPYFSVSEETIAHGINLHIQNTLLLLK